MIADDNDMVSDTCVCNSLLHSRQESSK